MKYINLIFLFFGFVILLSSCEALEKTDLVKSEIITTVQGKAVIYEMHVTGLDKFRYNFLLAGLKDTTQLFEARFTDETACDVAMEIEQTHKHLKIKLGRPTPTQTKVIDGFTYELQGSK